MKISFAKYFLELKHAFTISYSSRKTTPIVLVRLEHEDLTGYGEAALPPYLSETQETVIEFLKGVAEKKYSDTSKLLNGIDKISIGNTVANAAIDIALHDLAGKLQNKSCYQLYNIQKTELPFTSFTIGIDEPDVMKQKIFEAEEYKILKIKLGTNRDKEIISLIREETCKPLYVDINQGWINREYALEMSNWLAEQNVLLIEQPFNKNDLENSAWLSQRSPIPIIADESIQRLADLEKIKNSFNGINIKLMKCSGIAEAYKMILKAREFGLKIMLGCMTETSCAIFAAVQLSSLVDYADLDGNLLITNDPFEGKTIHDGRLQFPVRNGLGIELKNEISFQELN
jgi:L-Ala-D/L-Glu epimerase